MEESEGSSEMEFTNIDTSLDSLERSVIFHIVNDVVAFVLFMHQQIPSVLQEITLEFDELQAEYNQLELELATTSESVISVRRKQTSRKREVRMGIRRLEKLMSSVYNLKNAIQLMITEASEIDKIAIVLGNSPLRSLYVYELCFSHVRAVADGNTNRNKVANSLSRKAIRSLVSKGAGSDSYSGPMKLFLLVKAPSTFNLPLHFLPKREFRHNKKKVPFRLRFRCKTRDNTANAQSSDSPCPVGLSDSTSKDLVWFQCRHSIKGLALKSTPQED